MLEYSSNSLKISLITATYNCEEFLADCIDSVSSQSYSNIEHIVIDGGSSDGTLGILKRYRARLAVCVSGPDKGIYDALNKGLAYASGDIVGFLHADDLFASRDSLSHIADVFINKPSVDAVFGDLQYVSREDRSHIIRNWKGSIFTNSKLYFGWMPPHPTLYIRKQLYDAIGGFSLRYRISSDYSSIISLFMREDFESIYLPEVLVQMRSGGMSNRSLRNIILKSIEDYDIIKKSGLGGGLTLAFKNLRKLVQFI